MAEAGPRKPTVGSSVDDLCRVCKMSRRHTVLAVADADRMRVRCDTCGSQHNYRGRPEVVAVSQGRDAPAPRTTGSPAVTERERSFPPMSLGSDASSTDLELMLRRVIREETGLTPVKMADKWRGGEMALRPARADLQEKTWPIETFFNKVVMIRNRLRTLEQQVNAADLPQELKLKLQSYVTGCYGSLTSFNVLFADEDDRFRGAGGA